jgi:hypothetical protein
MRGVPLQGLIEIGARLLHGGDGLQAVPTEVVLVVLQLIDQLLKPPANVLEVPLAPDLAARGRVRRGGLRLCQRHLRGGEGRGNARCRGEKSPCGS